VEICQLVDGMPLAIELAVGWLKTLQPADIAREIRRNTDILETRSRNLPERHRNIRSVFQHSWQLLTENERDVFKKLSFFRAGFTREAAEIVAGASLYTLAGLVDKSLIRLGANGRYDVHELLRQYGAEQLDSAQINVTQRAYIDYYLGMLRQLEADIKAHHQMEALDTIADDFDNIRNAWLMAVEQGHFEALNGAVESLHFFADMRGRYVEVVTLLHTAIECFPPSPTMEQNIVLHRIHARLIRLIFLGNLRIDFDPRMQMDACLKIAYESEDQAEIAYCLLVSGLVDMFEDNRQSQRFQESLAIYEALGDPFYEAEAMIWVACLVWNDEAFNKSFAMRRELGDYNGIAWLMLMQVEGALEEMNYGEVEKYARESLALMRKIGSLKGVVQSIFKLAPLLFLKGDFEEARTLIEQMRDLADETNNLDGKMLSSGLYAFIISVMDENYAQGQIEAQKNHRISLLRFFGWNYMVARWGGAVASCGLGDYASARAEYGGFIKEKHQDPGHATVCLALEAAARNHEGKFEEASELLGLAFNQPAETSGWLHRWQLISRLQDSLKLQLGDTVFNQAWERGAEFDVATIVRAILGETDSDTRQKHANLALIEPLSDRELEVLGLIVDGLTNRDIAERLVLSVGTVKVHARNIYGKLNVNSRTQAVAMASRYNLL
ncbi:MAG: LuxR C-terminal-related transcriptional regulator, partial [Aggregatilineales bacterium]